MGARKRRRYFVTGCHIRNPASASPLLHRDTLRVPIATHRRQLVLARTDHDALKHEMNERWAKLGAIPHELSMKTNARTRFAPPVKLRTRSETCFSTSATRRPLEQNTVEPAGRSRSYRLGGSWPRSRSECGDLAYFADTDIIRGPPQTTPRRGADDRRKISLPLALRGARGRARGRRVERTRREGRRPDELPLRGNAPRNVAASKSGRTDPRTLERAGPRRERSVPHAGVGRPSGGTLCCPRVQAQLLDGAEGKTSLNARSVGHHAHSHQIRRNECRCRLTLGLPTVWYLFCDRRVPPTDSQDLSPMA
jgi:hypothetical protein